MHSVLIVDDEPAIRQVLTRWLAKEGLDIREAADAEAAVAAMVQTPAGVVLCDIEMPGHNGLWLAAELRDRFPQTAIVLATAVATVPPTTSLRSGIVDYLVKPFTREAVVSAVRRASEWHAAALAAPAQGIEKPSLAAWLEGGDGDL